MKLLLTGATGAAGLEVLRYALSDPTIAHVTILSRRPLPPSIPPSPKANVIIHNDFLSYPASIVSQFSDHDACIWALGMRSQGATEEEYMKSTHDYPMAAAKAMKDAGMGSAEKPVRFVYFSGQGVEQEGGTFMFQRVKGKTERDLLEFANNSSGHFKAQMIRPGYFFPSNPEDRQTIRTASQRFFDTIMSPILNTLMPNGVIPAKDLGRFAVDVAKGIHGDDDVFLNAKMVELIKSRKKDEL